jgi:site-specific recombinase XerC
LALRKQRRDRGLIKPATYRQDKTHLDEHILPALGNLPLGQITQITVKKFVRALPDKPLAFNTVGNVLSVLRVFLDDVLAEGWAELAGNPARHPSVRRELPKRPSRTRGIAHFTIDEMSTLLRCQTAPVERRVRYLVGVCAGLRDGEVSALRFSTVIPTLGAGPTLHIQEALALDTAEKGIGFLSPKTESSVRRVPVHPLLGEVLEWWKSTGWARWVGRQPVDDDLIFPDPDGKPWRPRSAELIRDDLKLAGLPETYAATKKTSSSKPFGRRSPLSWLRQVLRLMTAPR